MAGLGTAVLIIVINRLLGVWSSAAEEAMAVESDKRATLMTQVVESIEAVKVFGWEEPFCDRLDTIRKRECELNRKVRCFCLFGGCVAFTCSRMLFDRGRVDVKPPCPLFNGLECSHILAVLAYLPPV
jgi:hypothetical protein